MSQLLSLYISILVPILSQWISVEDLCCLDTAVCTQDMRVDFLKLLRVCTTYPTDITRFSASFKAWLLSRGMKVRKYNTDWNIRPEEQTKILNGVEYVESKNGEKLLAFFKSTKANVQSVKLAYSHDTYELLVIANIGQHITELELLNAECPHETLAKACPNLRKVHLFAAIQPSPYVEHCHHLEAVFNCQFEGLERKERWRRMSFDLMNTSVVDESAVCLGEGKYFNLTGLRLYNRLDDEDEAKLVPLLPQVTVLSLLGHEIIVDLPAKDFHDCTSLEFGSFYMNEDNLFTIVRNSSTLLKIELQTYGIRFGGNRTVAAVDALLIVVAECCPLLEKCCLHEVKVRGSTLATLFQSTSLKQFELTKRDVHWVKAKVCSRRIRSTLHIARGTKKFILDEVKRYLGPFREVKCVDWSELHC